MKKGFTFIELLVTIAILGIISATVITSLESARTNATRVSTQAQMSKIVDLLQVARETSGKTLLQITGNGCTDCACRSVGTPLYALPSNHACITGSTLTFSRIATELREPGFVGMMRDPWGNPYLFDENEGEGGSWDCRDDTLRSAGPDGYYSTADDVLPLKSYRTLMRGC